MSPVHTHRTHASPAQQTLVNQARPHTSNWTATQLPLFVSELSARADASHAAQLVADTALTSTEGAACWVLVTGSVAACAGATEDSPYANIQPGSVQPGAGHGIDVVTAAAVPNQVRVVVAFAAPATYADQTTIQTLATMLGLSLSAMAISQLPSATANPTPVSRGPQRLSDAHTDPLTGLDDHASFTAELQAVFAAVAAGTRQTVGCVLFIDLDYFTSVTDTHGRAAGDELLTVTGSRLRNSLRNTDIVAHLRADTFAVLLPAITDAVASQAVAQRVHTALSRPVQLAGLALWPSTSIGVAHAQADDTAESLLEHASQAMHQAKIDGRGRVQRYDTFTSTNTTRQMPRQGRRLTSAV